jgi:hypothetical protein
MRRLAESDTTDANAGMQIWKYSGLNSTVELQQTKA